MGLTQGEYTPLSSDDQSSSFKKTFDPTPVEESNDELITPTGPRPFFLQSIFGFTWPYSYSSLHWVGWIIGLIINLTLIGFAIYLWVVNVDTSLPVKGVCIGSEEINNHFCILAIGQITKGVFCLGQINIGIVSVGQISVGLFFAIGQIALSAFYAPAGQCAVGCFVEACQVGCALIRMRIAQVGWAVLHPFLGHDAFVSCHKYRTNT